MDSNKVKLKVINADDINMDGVAQAARQQGIDLAVMREKAGKDWRQVTPLLKRAYAADVLSSGQPPQTLRELSTLMSALFTRSGDFNAWLLQMERMSREGDPADFGRRVHELSGRALEESIRANLGVPKKIDGRQGWKKDGRK